jgi:glycosyltransferase involved in cell wall biosynthesis
VAAVPEFVDHVVVVDDGSADATADRAAAAGAGRAGLEILRHERNLGVGAAIAAGERRALARACDAVAVMAGDGQMDPRDLPALLDPLVDGRADHVKGNRFADPAVWRRMPPARLLGNIVLSLLTRVASGYWHLFDSQCGYTATRREGLLRAGLHLYPRYGYLNDWLARARDAGLRVEQAPVRAIYDGARSGIRWFTVVYPIGYLLARALARRMARRLARTGRAALALARARALSG